MPADPLASSLSRTRPDSPVESSQTLGVSDMSTHRNLDSFGATFSVAIIISPQTSCLLRSLGSLTRGRFNMTHSSAFHEVMLPFNCLQATCLFWYVEYWGRQYSKSSLCFRLKDPSKNSFLLASRVSVKSCRSTLAQNPKILRANVKPNH